MLKKTLIAMMSSAAISLGGCVTTGSQATFCDAAKPITWSKLDTAQTKKEIKSHNAAGKAICGWHGHSTLK